MAARPHRRGDRENSRDGCSARPSDWSERLRPQTLSAGGADGTRAPSDRPEPAAQRTVSGLRILAAIAIGCLAGGVLPQSHAQDASPSQRYEYAKALAASGATEVALTEFDALLAEFPDDADYLLGRAQMQARLGRNAAAVETAERALRLAPDYEDVWQLRLR